MLSMMARLCANAPPQALHELSHPLCKLTLCLHWYLRHSRGRAPGLVCRTPIKVSLAAPFEIRIPGGEHSTDVIRQGQERAHRNVRLTTRS
jgi:hypothetical protein